MNASGPGDGAIPIRTYVVVFALDFRLDFGNQAFKPQCLFDFTGLHLGKLRFGLLARRIADQRRRQVHDQGRALARIKGDAVQAFDDTLQQLFGIDVFGAAFLDVAGKLPLQLIDYCEPVTPFVAVNAAAQMRVHQQVAPSWIQEFD